MVFLQWATFAVSVIGAVAALAAAWAALSDRSWERGASMRREAALWKLLRGGRFGAPGKDLGAWEVFTPRRDGSAETTLELTKIELIGPRGARMAPLKHVAGAERPDLERIGRRIEFETRTGRYPDGVLLSRPLIGPQSHPDLGFFVELPPRSWWRRSAIVRIRVVAEEMSASRPRIKITLTSAPIALIAAVDASSNGPHSA